MNQGILRTKLRNGQNVYIFDEYEDAVVKLIPMDEKTKVLLKRKTGKEKELPFHLDIVADIVLSGEEVDETFYSNYQ